MEQFIYPVIPIWQPFATLVVTGEKRLETRSHKIKPGTYLIHACKRWNNSQASLLPTEPFRSVFKRLYQLYELEGDYSPLVRSIHIMNAIEKHLLFGRIIGKVEIGNAWYVTNDTPDRIFLTMDELTGARGYSFSKSSNEYHFGNYEVGRVAMELNNAVVFSNPIPYIGKQGISKYISEVEL